MILFLIKIFTARFNLKDLDQMVNKHNGYGLDDNFNTFLSIFDMNTENDLKEYVRLKNIYDYTRDDNLLNNMMEILIRNFTREEISILVDYMQLSKNDSYYYYNYNQYDDVEMDVFTTYITEEFKESSSMSMDSDNHKRFVSILRN